MAREWRIKTGTLGRAQGYRKVLILYGGRRVVRSGLLERPKAPLNNQVVACIELGGGSVIDSAKAI